MKVSQLFVAAALLSMRDVPNDPVTASPPASAGVHDISVQRPGQIEPGPTPVILGDTAPDFSYQGTDGRWLHLHDLVQQGSALLVFGANDVVLRAIEHDRDRLMDLGVIPVAVLDVRGGAARGLVQRLSLRYLVIADARGVIAGQFNAVDQPSGRQVPSLFVLDRARRVREVARGNIPVRGFVSLAANALGMPEPETPLPASR